MRLSTVCFGFAADFERSHWIDYEECEWIGFEYFQPELRLCGRVCCGGLQCGNGHPIPLHGVQ